MAQVNVTVNGRTYLISCEDGQEAHLLRLARYLDKRTTELVAAVGQVGDARLLVMVSLLIADELSDAYSEIKKLRSNPGPEVEAQETSEEIKDYVSSLEMDMLAARLETLALRLESLANKIDKG